MLKIDPKDIEDAKPEDLSDIKSQSKIEALPALARAGMKLAMTVLSLIGGFILIIFILFCIKEYSFESSIDNYNTIILSRDPASAQDQSLTAISESKIKQLKEIVELHKQERANFREFLIDLSQMILLNVLLPVLTAILGYIFGKEIAE